MKKNMSVNVSKIRISVIMPVYNNEKYFPKAVQSVERQEYDDYELIIVDDGSTDCTSDIADELAKKSSHIRVVHLHNQWIYKSFNNGIAAAQGEYVYILNSDDTLEPGTFQRFSEIIDLYHPDVVLTQVMVHECDGEQNIIRYDIGKVNQNKVINRYYSNKKDVENAWPFFLSTGLVQNQANLYKRDILNHKRFRNDVYGADTLYNISIADYVQSVYVLKKPVYNFFLYKCDERNASVGKYYSYEHEMFNEMYIEYKKLFQHWKLPRESYCELLYRRRLSELRDEIRHMKYSNCQMTIEEKLKKSI